MWLWMCARSVWVATIKACLPFKKTLGKLVTDAVGFFWRNFTRLERLPHLIGDNITFLAAPGCLLVQPFRQQKFFVHGQRAALVAADQLALLGLVRVLDIAGMVVQTSPDGLAFVFCMGISRVAASILTPLQKENAAHRRHQDKKYHNPATQPLKRSAASAIKVPMKINTKQPNSATSKIKNCSHS